MLEDADGSLVVIDTGGWYKLCCPTSQLHKPDVLGAIYRIRRQGAPRVEDPRGQKLQLDALTAGELSALLDDARPAVRRRAIQLLAKKEEVALPALKRSLRPLASVESRRNAVWASTRIDGNKSRALSRKALTDADESVRQAAIHSASVRRDADAVSALLDLLRGRSLHNRRAAAEALGRIGDKTAVPALVQSLGGQNDAVLDHSLTFALIEIGDRDGLATALKSGNVRVRRAALTALDQVGGLEPQTVARDPRRRRLHSARDGGLDRRAPPRMGRRAGRFSPRSAWQLATFRRPSATSWSGTWRASPALPRCKSCSPSAGGGADKAPAAARIALQAMAVSGLKTVPDTWIAALTRAVQAGGNEVVADAAATARRW